MRKTQKKNLINMASSDHTGEKILQILESPASQGEPGAERLPETREGAEKKGEEGEGRKGKKVKRIERGGKISVCAWEI